MAGRADQFGFRVVFYFGNVSTRFTALVEGQKPISYTWAFGDGHTGTTAQPRHTYENATTHTAILTATNSLGTAIDTLEVAVIQMPELIGGLRGIQLKIRYPEKARKVRIQGRVILQFVVDENGDIRDLRVVQSVSPEIDEEAMRVLRPARFKPGILDGKPVKVKMSIPVTFRLK